MKLKLETPDLSNPHLTILIVSEKIEAPHVAVLKAGLTKLFQSGKKTVIVDLTAITSAELSTAGIDRELLALRAWAAGFESQVLTVSALDNLGHVKTREQAVQLINSGEGPLLARESKLQAEIQVALAKKGELERLLEKSNAQGDPKMLLRAKSDLTKSVSEAQRIANRFMKNRASDPYNLPAFQLAREALEEILVTVLKKEGVL